MSRSKGINCYDEKQRREQRRKNHEQLDVRMRSGRRIKKIEEQDDGVYYEDIRYDEEDS